MGIGSKLKKAIRNIIPNELAEVAVKAAPFVAPFNPAIAAAMSGLGSFDKTGRIGDSLKSGIGTYALGQGARYLGGAEFQGNPFVEGGAFRPGGIEGFKSSFTSPLGEGGPFSTKETASASPVSEAQTNPLAAGPDLPADMAQALPRGTVVSTEKINPSFFTRIKTAKGMDKLKVAYDFMTDPKNKMIVSALGGTAAAVAQYLENKAMEEDQLDLTKGSLTYDRKYFDNVNPTVKMTRPVAKNGGIIGLANGGEPAMEMDYRDGGFIPVGAYERADDVPARLSKNEFVMTADAVRAAGGGSIEKGSQKMYDLMNNLEAQA